MGRRRVHRVYDARYRTLLVCTHRSSIKRFLGPLACNVSKCPSKSLNCTGEVLAGPLFLPLWISDKGSKGTQKFLPGYFVAELSSCPRNS